jgi:YfiH family protein
MNLGLHVGDDPACVLKNRSLWMHQLGVQPIFLNQVHGQSLIELTPKSLQGQEADACFTVSKGVACTMMVADCMPILIAHPSGSFVGALHVGWRGFLGVDAHDELMEQGILAHALDSISKSLLSQGVSHETGQVWAWLGPCIGVNSFEVGPLVRDLYVARFGADHGLFRAHHSKSQKWYFNLTQAVSLELGRLGIENRFGNNGSTDWCTVTQEEFFFSHRRDGVSGRFCASIWLQS